MSRQQPPKFKDYTKAYFNQPGKLDNETRNELILTYTPLIKYIAARLASRLPPQVAVDDLVSCGIIGLIDAIEKFDINKQVQFKTYAEFRIKGAMLDELRSLDWTPRSVRRKITQLEKTYEKLERDLGRPATDEETAAALDLKMEEYYKVLDETKSVTFMDIDLLRQKFSGSQRNSFIDMLFAGDKDPFSVINMSQVRNLLAKAIEELPEKEKLTVTLYYFEELTMKEIGEIMGYTESRISQMHSKSMLRLRTKLKTALTG